MVEEAHLVWLEGARLVVGAVVVVVHVGLGRVV
jgi:hypothetical protein